MRSPLTTCIMQADDSEFSALLFPFDSAIINADNKRTSTLYFMLAASIAGQFSCNLDGDVEKKGETHVPVIAAGAVVVKQAQTTDATTYCQMIIFLTPFQKQHFFRNTDKI